MARRIDAELTLKDKFSPVLKQVSRNIQEQSKIHQRLGKDIESTGKSISSFGKATAFISAPLVAAAGAGFALSQSLDKSTARVGMLGQITKEQTAVMKKGIVEVSNATGVASETIADATQKAIAGGINAGDSMKYMAENIKYSKVSGMELNQTVEVTNAYTKAYNLTIADTARLNDQQVMTARLAKVEMSAMSPALAGVAKSAADAGISVQQMDAAYVMMVRRGTDNGKAASSLSGLFDSFSKASPKAIKAAQDFGIELNQAHIKAVGFPAFLQEIQTKTGGNQAAIGKIIKDVEAFKLALSMTSGDGASEYLNVLDQIQNSGGATAESLARLKTPAGETAKAMNQIKNAGIELVDGLQPLWTRSATMIKQVVSAFNSLTDEQKNMIFSAMKLIIVTTVMSGIIGKTVGIVGKGVTMFGNIGAGIEKAGSFIGYLATKFSTLITIFKAIGTAARFLFMTPVGLAITAIVIAAYLIYDNWGKVKEFFVNLWAGVVNVFNSAVTAIKGWMDKMGITEKLQSLIPKIATFIAASIGLFMLFKNGVIAVFMAIVSPVISLFSMLWTGINSQTLSSGGMITTILKIISASFGIMVNLVGIYLNGFLNIVGIVVGGIISVFSGIITFITGVFTGNWAMAWQGVVEIFSGIFSTIEGICNTVMSTIKAAINAVISGVNSVSINVPEWVPVVGGQHYQPSIPMLAKGTDNWGGGLAMVHDAGAEIIDLPSGSRVYPHSKSLDMARKEGRKESNGNSQSFTLQKLADTIIVREEADIDKIVERLAFKLKSHAINQAEGAT
jgi:TP901 family phage tail tape measure protein